VWPSRCEHTVSARICVSRSSIPRRRCLCLRFTRHLAAPAQDLRSRWFATPFLWGSFIPYYTPVYPDDCAPLRSRLYYKRSPRHDIVGPRAHNLLVQSDWFTVPQNAAPPTRRGPLEIFRKFGNGVALPPAPTAGTCRKQDVVAPGTQDQSSNRCTRLPYSPASLPGSRYGCQDAILRSCGIQGDKHLGMVERSAFILHPLIGEFQKEIHNRHEDFLLLGLTEERYSACGARSHANAPVRGCEPRPRWDRRSAPRSSRGLERRRPPRLRPQPSDS